MQFAVERTSMWNGGPEERPCDEAYWVANPNYDDPDYDDPGYWAINIDTVEQLIRMKDKYGKIIIRDSYTSLYEGLCLEIYDNYRE